MIYYYLSSKRVSKPKAEVMYSVHRPEYILFIDPNTWNFLLFIFVSTIRIHIISVLAPVYNQNEFLPQNSIQITKFQRHDS